MLSTRPSDDELFMEMAHVAAKRSLCDRDQVGAVIISSFRIVISTGRNGPPHWFNHQDRTCEDWCPRTKAFSWAPRNDFAGPTPDLIFEDGKTFVSFSPTHTFRKEIVTDEDWEHCGFVKKFTGALDYSDCFTIHAEANALLTSNRDQRMGGTIYVTSDPCWSCAKMIANSGLRALVVETNDQKADERHAIKTYEFLESLSIEVTFLEKKGEDSGSSGTP